MPELPNVAGFKSYLGATALHQPVVRASVRDARILDEGTTPRGLARRLKRRSFERTRRHGKWLLVEDHDGPVVALHFGMTGGLTYHRGRTPAPRSARVVWSFGHGRSLAYTSKRMLGHVALVEHDDRFIAEHDLGLDALDGRLNGEWFARTVHQHDRAIKPLLMDQSVLAGLGNVYADEVLYQSGLRPSRRAATLSEEEAARLFRVTRRVLRIAAGHGGDTDRLPGRYLLPHRKADGRCGRCGRRLREQKVSGRTAVYCPRCQPSR